MDFYVGELYCRSIVTKNVALLILHLIEVLMTFWQQPNGSANQYGPNNDYPISLHRVNHKTFATLQNGSVDPKKLQSPKFICTIH